MLTVIRDGWPGHYGRKDEVSQSLIDESGRRLVVRNGYHQSREVLLAFYDYLVERPEAAAA
jgi:hypothetical protein